MPQPVSFRQVHLHVARDERDESNRVPASLICIHMVQVNLDGVDFRWLTGTRKAFKLHQGTLVGILRVSWGSFDL